MDVYLHKLVTISKRKFFGKISSELHLVGTNLDIPFLSKEENLKIDGKYAVNIKDVRAEIDAIKKISKSVIFKNGEPCLQRMPLKSLATYAKQKGMHVIVETYGTFPNIIEDMINKGIVDMIILKAYFPLNEAWLQKINKGKLISNNKELINEIKKTIKILSSNKINVQAKTYIVKDILFRNQDISKIVNSLSGIRNLNYEITALDDKVSNDIIEGIKHHISDKFKGIKIK